VVRWHDANTVSAHSPRADTALPLHTCYHLRYNLVPKSSGSFRRTNVDPETVQI
jgi:hypothetical protein